MAEKKECGFRSKESMKGQIDYITATIVDEKRAGIIHTEDGGNELHYSGIDVEGNVGGPVAVACLAAMISRTIFMMRKEMKAFAIDALTQVLLQEAGTGEASKEN